MRRNCMAEILDKDLPIHMGNCIHVVNCEKKSNLNLAKEPDVFICIQVEDETGKDEYPILMTQDEFDKLEKAVLPDMDSMIPGRIYHKFLINTNRYCVKLKEDNGQVYVGVFDIEAWATYFKRAISHPMSCTKKSFITDLFD